MAATAAVKVKIESTNSGVLVYSVNGSSVRIPACFSSGSRKTPGVFEGTMTKEDLEFLKKIPDFAEKLTKHILKVIS